MKMFKFYFRLLMTLPFFFLISCDDDSGSLPIGGEITPPTAAEFSLIRETALANLTQNFTHFIDVDNPEMIEFTSANGVKVRFYSGCLSINGEQVEGEIDIEFIELFNKGNLLTTNIATMGKHSNGDLSMLITGGAFYVNVTQNGQVVDSCGMNMEVPGALTGGIDNDMILWYGEFDENGGLVWEEANGEQGQGGEFWMDDDTYYIWANQFGWTNVDRFYNDERPKTIIYVDVPDGYNPENCAVYLSYNGELGLARLDTYDESEELFSEHYGLIPIGLQCNVIFVSENNGQWSYAIKAVTIQADSVIQIEESELNATTETGLTNLINALP